MPNEEFGDVERRCPHCKRKIFVPEPIGGFARFACAHCQRSITVCLVVRRCPHCNKEIGSHVAVRKGALL